MTFDFKSYLERLDPAYRYQIDRLTGGVINFTVRATKIALKDSDEAVEQASRTSSGLDLQRGAFPGHQSLILKHATSHIAEVGEGSHIPQTRQLVEATALALFLGEPRNLTNHSSIAGEQPGPLHDILEKTGIMIPELIHYDETNHVLILSDLGPLPDLSRVFCELGGYTPGLGDTRKAPHPVPHSPRLGERLGDTEVLFFEMLGHKLGNFFAQLHSRRTRDLIFGASPNGFPSLPEMKVLVHEHAIKPLRAQLLLFRSLITADEAATLFSAIEADFLRDTAEQERCFVIGDCWTGTVLLDLESRAEEIGIGVIDWEFANTSGRGPNGDISQFLAHLELFLIAAYSQGEEVAPGHISALKAILKGFLTGYKNEQDKAQGSGLKDMIMRSAFLSHGAELINCAFWKIWACKDSECLSCRQKNVEVSSASLDEKPNGSQSVAEEGSNPQCTLVTKMVSRGLSFLRCAVAQDPMEASKILLREDPAYGKLPGLSDFFS